MDTPSQNLAQNRPSRHRNVFICTHWTKPVKVSKVRILNARSGNIVLLLTPEIPTTVEGDQRYRFNQRCTIKTKLVFVFQPARLCPNNCGTNDGRQIRLEDRDAQHAQKLMLSSIGPRQGTGNTIIKDGHHWSHRPYCVRTTHDISSVIFRLMWLHVTLVRFTVHVSRQLSIFIDD